MKKTACILLALLLMLGSACAVSEEEEAFFMNEEDLFQYNQRITYRELGVKKGTKLPVYGAPYEDAWRGANGKAAVSTSEAFLLLGWNTQHTWLMVEYTTSAPERRVGWIRADTEGLIDAELWPFSRCLLRTTENTYLTDDPRGGKRKIASLAAGETLIGLWRITDTPWIYAEGSIGGKTVWAFVPADAVESVPLYHLEGDTLVVHDEVTWLGSTYADDDDAATVPGDVALSTDWMMDPVLEAVYDRIRTIRLPDSLRHIGIEALVGFHVESLALPEGLVSVSPDAFYGISIGTLRLPSTLTDPGGILDSSYCSIGAWEVAEDNPAWCAVDGVLFTKDRSILTRYPNGSPRLHYDVPAGTAAIADRAFDDDSMNLPLVTVSLPIGLRKIGEYAFSGCGRLISLTVPLTVTELAPSAFRYCVSLERLSLPPGLTAQLSEWAEQADFTRFNGDNGATGTEGKPVRTGDDGTQYVYGLSWVDSGSGAAAVYPDAYGSQPCGTLRCGETFDYSMILNGRAGHTKYTWDDETGTVQGQSFWVSLEDLLPVTGDVIYRSSYALVPPGAMPVDANRPIRDWDADWEPMEWGGFWTGDILYLHREKDRREEEAGFFLGDLTLYREHTGDQRTFGILAAGRSGEAVQLYDEAYGAPIAHYYTGEQAELLSREEDWIRVRTAGGSGWIPEEYFRTVEQEPEQTGLEGY